MGARLRLNGFTEWSYTLEGLLDQRTVDGICKMGVFDGAAVVLDETRAAISALPVSNDPARGVRADQKRGLLDGLGTADMREDGGRWNTWTGVDGYNSHRTPKYPGGQPNPMIARSVEIGTSFSPARHTFSSAIRSARAKALEAMRETVESEIEKTIK